MNLLVKYLQNLWEIASGQAKNGLVCASVGFLFHRITIAIIFWVTPRARARYVQYVSIFRLKSTDHYTVLYTFTQCSANLATFL
jgi:hypothetical protein